MNARPALPPTRPVTHLVAATLAALITLGIIDSIDELFTPAARPLEPVVAIGSPNAHTIAKMPLGAPAPNGQSHEPAARNGKG